MNSDKITSVLGIVAAVSGAVATSPVIAPATAGWFGLTGALSIALLGYFTNKPVRAK